MFAEIFKKIKSTKDIFEKMEGWSELAKSDSFRGHTSYAMSSIMESLVNVGENRNLFISDDKGHENNLSFDYIKTEENLSKRNDILESFLLIAKDTSLSEEELGKKMKELGHSLGEYGAEPSIFTLKSPIKKENEHDVSKFLDKVREGRQELMGAGERFLQRTLIVKKINLLTKGLMDGYFFDRNKVNGDITAFDKERLNDKNLVYYAKEVISGKDRNMNNILKNLHLGINSSDILGSKINLNDGTFETDFINQKISEYDEKIKETQVSIDFIEGLKEKAKEILKKDYWVQKRE